jgi:hypothetical protein
VTLGEDKQPVAPRPAGGRNNSAATGRADPDNRPRQVTVQVGKRWSEIIMGVRTGEYTWAEFCEGLDEEELARGQLKDRNGGFSGRPPKMVPREFHLACQREMKKRFDQLFQQDVIKVAKSYLAMAQSATLKEETKAKMLQYAMERVFGGIPKDVRLSQEQPWEQMVVNVVTDAEDAMPDHLRRRYAGYAEREGSTEES